MTGGNFAVTAVRLRNAVCALVMMFVSEQTALAGAPAHHTVSAGARTGAPVAEVVIRDDDLVGRRIVKATYVLYDGYEKTVLIPNGAARLKAVDIANRRRADVPSSQPWPCTRCCIRRRSSTAVLS